MDLGLSRLSSGRLFNRQISFRLGALVRLFHDGGRYKGTRIADFAFQSERESFLAAAVAADAAPEDVRFLGGSYDGWDRWAMAESAGLTAARGTIVIVR